MKAAVFHKPGEVTCDTVDDPRIEMSQVSHGYKVSYKKKEDPVKIVLKSGE